MALPLVPLEAVLAVVFGLIVPALVLILRSSRKASTAAPAEVVASKPTVGVVSLVSAFPHHEHLQSDTCEAYIERHCGGKKNLTPKDEDFIRRVFKGTKCKTCRIPLPKERVFERMSRPVYTTYVKEAMKDMATRATIEALKRANLRADQITHLVFGTMTGTIHAPTLDIHIALEQKFSPYIKRLNVESMGCLTGFRITGLARDMAAEDPKNIVLAIVVDIRSALGNQLLPHPPAVDGQAVPMDALGKGNVIVSALFRDSGAACIFRQVPKLAPSRPLFEIVDHRSYLIPNSLDHVLLQEMKDGVIHLNIGQDLPHHIEQFAPTLVFGLLKDAGVRKEDCLFAVHTGGPKVIDAIETGLRLQKEQLVATWFVMKHYGNLSGSSNLVTLDHLQKILKREIKNASKPLLPGTIPHYDEEKQQEVEKVAVNEETDIVFPKDLKRFTHAMCLSMGPGVGMESVLFKLNHVF